MATKVRKGPGSALDLAMAAFAAVAVGFIVFAMPNPQFDRAVELSGLPLLLAAAQPPLGATARNVAVIIAAIGTWALVWLVLRALSQKPPEPKLQPQPVEIEMPLPRLRRADAHPDAPARRPILAGLELGTPLNQLAETEQEAEPEPDEPRGQELAQEQVDAEEPDSALPHSDALEPHAQGSEIEEVLEAAEVHDSVPPAEAAGQDEAASIAHLMQRLELGLLRREHPSWALPAEKSQQEADSARQIDQRLRSAIDDLQRLATRGG